MCIKDKLREYVLYMYQGQTEGLCLICVKDKLREYALYVFKGQTEGVFLIHV